jgi:hypothetical protein
VPERVEIGYLCSHNHFVFHDDPDGGGCGSKRIAGVYVERDPGVEFYEPYEKADETGFVYFSTCGYAEEEYDETLEFAKKSLLGKIAFWRKNA